MCRRNSSSLRPRSSRFERPSVAVLVDPAARVALAVPHRVDLVDRVASAALHKADLADKADSVVLEALVVRAALVASVVLADRVA
jgi:hypothetical protein